MMEFMTAVHGMIILSLLLAVVMISFFYDRKTYKPEGDPL